MNEVEAHRQLLESTIYQETIYGVDVTLFDLSHSALSNDAELLMKSPYLQHSERQRSRKFLSSSSGALWLQGRIILRLFLAQHLSLPHGNIKIRYNERGKPFLDGVALSLAHCSSFLAVAVSATSPNIGIDIEEYRGYAPSATAIKQLHPLEQYELSSLTRESYTREFRSIWTRKEAYLKALGTGFLRDSHNDYTGIQFSQFHPYNTTFTKISCSASQQLSATLAVIHER